MAFDFLGVSTKKMWDEYIQFVGNCLEDIVSDSDDYGKAISGQVKRESERLLSYFKSLVKVHKFINGENKEGKQVIGDRSIMFANEDRASLFSEQIETCIYEKPQEVIGMGARDDNKFCFFNTKIKDLVSQHIYRRRENLEYQIKKCIDRIEYLFTQHEKLKRRVEYLDDFKSVINMIFNDEVNYYTNISKEDDLFTDRGVMLGRKSPSEIRETSRLFINM